MNSITIPIGVWIIKYNFFLCVDTTNSLDGILFYGLTKLSGVIDIFDMTRLPIRLTTQNNSILDTTQVNNTRSWPSINQTTFLTVSSESSYNLNVGLFSITNKDETSTTPLICSKNELTITRIG